MRSQTRNGDLPKMPLTHLMPPPAPAGISSDLLLEFFLVFSRFEYAMKAAGWTREIREALPDWDRLANAAQDEAPGLTDALLDAGSYLLQEPPKKQVRRPSGELAWSLVDCDADHRPIACLILSVRRVRNNLFHGGKFERLRDLSERNGFLVEGSLRVLQELLELSTCRSIREAYFDMAVDGG